MCHNEVCSCDNCNCNDCQCNVLNVEVKKKTKLHPFYGQGSDNGYSINGIEGAELDLIVGEKYLINYNNKEHPLYISSNPKGVGEGRLSGNITSPEIISFDKPGTFYYACAKRPFMGGVIFVHPTDSNE